MNFSLRTIIREFVAPEHKLSCSNMTWAKGLMELKRRGRGRHESGAFLLGTEKKGKCSVEQFVYYDDLDPHCLDTGIVIFDGTGFTPLWQLCRKTGLRVVADVHTHGGAPFQSEADRKHPMIAIAGHIALIVPNFAANVAQAEDLGIYMYNGSHVWENHSDKYENKFFYIGIWG